MPPRIPASGRWTRISLLTLGAILVALPPLTVVGQRTLETMLNAPPLWVPATLPYRQDFDWFRRHFHCEDILLLSFEGATLANEHVDKLAAELRSPSQKMTLGEDPADAEVLQNCLAGVVTGPELLSKILGNRLGLSREQAIERLRGSFIGDDGQSTCLLITLTIQGTRRRAEAIDAIVRATERVTGLAEEEIHLAGAPVDGAAIDAASLQAINRLALPSAVVAAALCLLLLRSWLLTGAIVLVALFGQSLVLAMVGLLGGEMNAVLTVMPALVFVLTISAGVHLANYFRDGLAAVGSAEATRYAFRRGVAPCLLATGTTVIGLLSLRLSEMSPIQTFGAVASVGTAVCLLLLLLLLPGAMQRIASRGVPKAKIPSRVEAYSEHAFDRLFRLVATAPTTLSLGFLLAMALFAWGLTAVRTSVSVESLFPAGSKVPVDNAWMSERIGPLVSLEVILQFPADSPYEPFDQLELVSDTQRAIDRTDELGGSLSAATFFPGIPKEGGLRNTSTRGMVRGRLLAELATLEESDYLVNLEGERSWRISSRAHSNVDTDYGQVLRKLKETLQPLVDRHAESGVRVIYTGSLPVAYEAQRALLTSLFRSFLAAFGLVTLVMIFVMRSLLGGLIAMIPNLFPTLAMFGLMGWLDAPVDIGAVMTASIALGIAVDDTLHFLFWWRREVAAGATPAEAVRASYASCGIAMAQTTLICGLGLLAYAFSVFVPTQRFAWFMLGLLLSALAGDLLLLPSLLLGPAGRWLRPRARESAIPPLTSTSEPEPAAPVSHTLP